MCGCVWGMPSLGWIRPEAGDRDAGMGLGRRGGGRVHNPGAARLCRTRPNALSLLLLSPLPVSLPFQKVMLPTGAAFRWFQ